MKSHFVAHLNKVTITAKKKLHDCNCARKSNTQNYKLATIVLDQKSLRVLDSDPDLALI